MLMAMILFVLSTSLMAQQTGSIVGTVTDKTGAVVPNAKVILTNTATKDLRNTITNGEGFFAFNGVVTGDYSVKIDSTGFRVAEQSGLHISPGDRKNINVALAIAKGSEQVTVEAEAAQIQVVDSGERSSVLSSKDIKNLALQGRDVTELVKTLPGFNNTTGGGGLGNYNGYDPTVTSIGSSVGNGYSASGTPNRTGTSLTSDGANVIDVGCNCNSTMTINADMVQEVKVSTSAFGADSAKGPVVIQAVGKSGSSEYHGGAYVHFRDSSMNSTDWINKHSKVDKPKDRYWYPGGSFGGPVPFTNKKAVFWTGYENYRQTFPDGVSHGVVSTVVPTMAMRAGNFDPNNADNQAFCAMGGWLPQCGGISSISIHGNSPSTTITGNNIAPYIDPSGAAIMKEIVTPNVTPTAASPYNFIKGVTSSDNGYMYRARVDYNFSDSTKLYVSYNQQRDDSGIPTMLWWLPPNSQTFPGGFVAGGDSKTISGNLVKVFSPTLTNEFIGTLAYLNNTKTYSNPDGVSRKALGYQYKGIFGASKYMPMLSTGWWIPGYPMIYQADADGYFAKKVTPTFTDNLTKVIGTHTIKAGFNWEKMGNDELLFNEQNGNYQFGPWGASGNPVANILLAVPTYYEESSPNVVSHLGYSAFGGYLQDDWKASKRLTFNLGLRLSHDPTWTDTSGKTGLATWTAANYTADIAANKTTLPGMRWNAMDGSVAMSGRSTKPVFVSPRFGLAFDVFGDGKTMLRGGWGAYYYHDSIDGYAGAITTALGGKKCAVYAATWLGDIDNGTNVSCSAVLGSTAVDPTDDKQAVTHTYNFTMSQQLPGNSLLEIAYSGNQTTDMINPLQNKNVIPLGAFFGKNPVTKQIETIHDIESGKRADGTTITKDQYRPMQQYGPLYVVSHGAWANYNALQVSWNKPRGALTYGLNYVWSKTMGINGQNNFQPDPVNIHNDYGIVNQDRTHVFNATYSYEVNTHFKGIVGGAVNGWMISGITGIQSGAPMAQSGSINYGLSGTSGDSYPNFYLDATSILGSSDYTLMPTLKCNPAEVSGGMTFNASCFGVPTKGTNGVYQSPYVHGPAFWNSDLRMGKTFKITEHHNVQFSAAAFNFLNHALTSFNPNDSRNRTLSFQPANSSLTDYTNYSGAYSLVAPGVGKPSIKYGRRVVELSLKYNF
jgi:hypothetical protein